MRNQFTAVTKAAIAKAELTFIAAEAVKDELEKRIINGTIDIEYYRYATTIIDQASQAAIDVDHAVFH